MREAGIAESTQVLVGDMETISDRMEEKQKIAEALETGTSIFENFYNLRNYAVTRKESLRSFLFCK